MAQYPAVARQMSTSRQNTGYQKGPRPARAFAGSGVCEEGGREERRFGTSVTQPSFSSPCGGFACGPEDGELRGSAVRDGGRGGLATWMVVLPMLAAVVVVGEAGAGRGGERRRRSEWRGKRRQQQQNVRRGVCA